MSVYSGATPPGHTSDVSGTFLIHGFRMNLETTQATVNPNCHELLKPLAVL